MIKATPPKDERGARLLFEVGNLGDLSAHQKGWKNNLSAHLTPSKGKQGKLFSLKIVIWLMILGMFYTLMKLFPAESILIAAILMVLVIGYWLKEVADE